MRDERFEVTVTFDEQQQRLDPVTEATQRERHHRRISGTVPT
jgi:hypothetical protein